MVRLLPQTAAFFQFTGLGVNLRNLAFEDVRVSTETVNGNRVFVIEGAITPTSRKAVEIPRLRFVVQDARGADIYAWNSVVDQAVIKPGEKVAFKSRLASPPADAHSSSSASSTGATWRPAACDMARILIADDEESMRQLVARAIAMDGHETTTAQDGAEALEILVRSNGAFDLLLTDIKMPVMDGIALALAAARDFPTLTILLMTGFADQRERASGLDAIIHDVITKPFAVADIRTAVADALASRADER